MKTKIIQICAIPETPETCALIIALCQDGTVWETPFTSDGKWGEWRQVLPK